jgi:hypothetical protein
VPRPFYPRLQQLLGAYFHQDWDLEGDDWPAIVRKYRSDVSAAEAAAAASEIEQLIADGDSDSILADRLLREFGCYYDPRPDLGGPLPREWLIQLAAALRE